jgi:RNA polymerase sigma-70 factor, ECF subfamily
VGHREGDCVFGSETISEIKPLKADIKVSAFLVYNMYSQFSHKRPIWPLLLMKDQRMINPQDLLFKAKQGDIEAFGSLYEAYFTPIYRYIFWRLRNKELAEDLVQTVFVKVFQKIDKFEDRGKNPLAYFFTVSRNLIIDYQRKNKEASLDELEEQGVQASDKKKDLIEGVENSLQLEKIIKALDSLAKEQREVIVLKFINNLPNEEIARLMNKNEAAIRQLQCRALKALREELKSEI